MSGNLTEEQKKKRKIISKSLKNQIKQKPHTETINGVEFVYGLLQKKSESSLFNNERFLIIKGHDTFGYASKLPEQTLLPFLDVGSIPKCKVQMPLDKIQVTCLQQVLIVEFQEDGKKQKTRWEFTCPSKIKAFEWRKKIQGARQEKNQNLKNVSQKVILQDPEQNAEESDNEAQKKKKKITVENPFLAAESAPLDQSKSKNQADGRQDGQQSLKQNTQAKILVREEESKEQNYQKEVSPKNGRDLQKSPESERFPEGNIFESLLYTSPSRSSDVNQKVTNLQEPREKSFYNSSKSPNRESEDVRSVQEVSPSNNSKEQFLKRKREESQLKEQLREQNSAPSFFGSVIKTIADNKYQLEKLKKDWGYEFAKSSNEFEIVEKFKTYSELVVVKIIDQLALQPRKRYYKPVSETSESLKYEIEGASFEFFFHELKEVTSFDKNASVIFRQRSKKAFQELKNYDYILQLTNNKGRIRVPIAMAVEYKGFVCLAKAIIPEAESYSNLESLQKELDLIQAESRINNSIFEDGQNGRIVPLMNKVYDKLARAENSTNVNPKKFDICYIQGLKHYLPQDFYRFNSEDSRGPQSINPQHVLRKELIQHEDYDHIVFYGENMSTVIQRLKMPQHFKQAIQTLSEVSKSISQRVNALITSLENLDEFVTNSKDLSKLMHGYGLNIRYLGLLLERSHEAWLRNLIISEISARCAKSFFQFDLQDCIMNLNESKPQNVRKFQIKHVITFLNKVLGNSEESDHFWEQLSRQSQENFQCYVDKKELNIGYFIQALQWQCRIQLVNVLQRKQDFFKVPQPLTVDHFCAFGVNSKTYDLSFTELYTTVGQHLKDLSQQSYEQLSILLNLSRKGSLPSHFKLNDFDEKVILYMINWLSPAEGRHIYYPEEIKLGEVMPTKALYQIKLTEIKWLLKDRKETEAEGVRDWIIDHVNKWLGEYHPVLSELYDIFSRYYSTMKSQQKKATTYCKSSIKNIEKLLGHTNIKLADNYYMLAEIYINYQKKTEALSSLKRAKEILEERDGTETEAYGIIELRMGQLLLASTLIKEALVQAIRAYSRLVQGEDLQKIVEALELIGRCYELTNMWTDYNKFSVEFMNSSNLFEQFSQNSDLLQRVLKFLFLPYFVEISKNAQTSKQLFAVLSLFSSLSSMTTSTQANSYNYIKSLISQNNNVFPQEFVGILENDLQELLEEVDSSGIMTRWKGFEKLIQNKSLVQKINSISTLNAKAYEFLLMLEALAVFLGEGWIEGVLKDQ